MAFDTSLPPIEEAAPLALIGWMVARLSTLNAMLTRDSATPIATVTSAQFFKGDSIPPPEFDVWFTVQNGERNSGMVLRPALILHGEDEGRGYANDYTATITAYVNPDALTDPNAPTATASAEQIGARHVLLSRLSGWLRVVCFNNKTALLIPMTSREYAASPGFDILAADKQGALQEIYQGELPNAPGSSLVCPAIQAVFRGTIQ